MTAEETLTSPKVRMTRQVTFSSGHRYWLTSRTDEENRRLFGEWASHYNHGHNYRLEVTVEGAIDRDNCMVVNIKTLDDVLQATIVDHFHNKSINDEIAWFADHSTSTESILLYIRDRLESGVLPREARLVGLTLWENELLYAEYLEEDEDWTMTLTRIYEFAAAHRLHVASLSHERNVALFGKCNNPSGHGHNYVLEVTVQGEPDPETGMLADLQAIDDTVNELVIERYDHKHLNLDLPEFQNVAPTSEIIASEIFKRLDGKLPATLRRVRLHETARSTFEISRS